MSALRKRLERIPPRYWIILVALLVVVIDCGNLGWAGPWDPWETHYGEVARNIVYRADPMDLWWRPGFGPDGKKEQLFASKHALPFWCMAVSMQLFGLGVGAADEMVRSPWPEFALRLPSMLAGWASAAFLGTVVARLTKHWRAGLLTAVVMSTLPQFALITRQAITDIYFVAPLCLAMGAWALAWFEPDRALRTRGRGWREIPWDRVYALFIVSFALGALLPLGVLHEHVTADFTIERVSRFAKRANVPSTDDLRAIAWQLCLYWGLGLVVLLRSFRWRRRSQAWMGLLYLAGGLSLMGKGMIGPGIIGLLVLSHLVVTGEWRRLLRCELPIGILIFVVSCFPWHHAMALYRGESWARELIIENNLARFSAGEQKQAVGDFAFYLETMGLAALPWVAVLPLSLHAALRRFIAPASAAAKDDSTAGSETDSAGELHRFALLCFVVSMALITYSVTKYYHYLAPALPSMAMLVGLWLHQEWDGKQRSGLSTSARCLGAAIGVLILFAVGKKVLAEPAWIAHLTTYLYTGMWKEGAPSVERLIVFTLPFGAGLILWAVRRQRAAITAMLLSATLSFAYIIMDYVPAASENWSQRSMLTYYFDHKKEEDKLLGWWFYYRGETFFSKRRIWVMMSPDRKKLAEYINEQRGKNVTLWVATTKEHARRAPQHFPKDCTIETAYENFHYTLLEVSVP